MAVYSGILVHVRPRIQRAAFAAIVVPALILTERAVAGWRSDTTLFSEMIEESPADPFGYQALGAAMIRENRHDLAETLLREAVALGPTTDDVYGCLALALTHNDKCSEGMDWFTRDPEPAIPLEPFFKSAAACFLRNNMPEDALILYRYCAPRVPWCAEKLAGGKP